MPLVAVAAVVLSKKPGGARLFNDSSTIFDLLLSVGDFTKKKLQVT
jgi:hypothetical protein